MASDRANWDQASTKKLLDLCIAEKNLNNFNKTGPTRLGWQHIYEGLNAEFGNRFDKKQVQNKLSSLRLKHNNWLQLQNQSGLGRDRNSGGVSADDSYWEQPDGGDSSDDHNRGHPPQFLEELSTLFGRTPQDRGTLIWARGVRERTPTVGTEDSPQDMSQDPLTASIAAPSSKSIFRDVEVDSPPKKRSASLEEYVRDIKDTVIAPKDPSYRKKRMPSFNVLAIVDMEMRFTYVGAGRAGSSHDMSVLRECLETPTYRHPPPGRYYLVDSGFALRQGYLGPYRNTKYHLEEFAQRRANSLQKNLNYCHSSLRNVVERGFGVLKNKWQILDGVPFYDRDKQVKMIIACFALHNFLLDREQARSAMMDMLPDADSNMSAWVAANSTDNMESVRNWIAVGLSLM